MATAKKATAKKAVVKAAPAKKAPVKALVKAPVKSAAKTAPKTVAKTAAKPVAAAPLKPVITGALKPIKTTFKKTSLIAHLATTASVDPKAAKAVFAALEATIVASIAKKGAGEFTLPGLFKVSSVHVPAKKARVGIDPFTKVERKFAAKPATTKVKLRAMKKLKDAALA